MRYCNQGREIKVKQIMGYDFLGSLLIICHCLIMAWQVKASDLGDSIDLSSFKEITINKINVCNLSITPKKSKEIADQLRQFMRLQEGETYQTNEIPYLLNGDIESLFNTERFVLVDIVLKRNEFNKSSQDLDLEIRYLEKDPSVSGLFQDGKLAVVGDSPLFINTLMSKLKKEGISLTEKNQKGQKTTQQKQELEIKKNILDKAIVEKICTEMYKKSGFLYPEEFFDKKISEIVEEKYKGDFLKLREELEANGDTMARWEQSVRQEIILKSCLAFLEEKKLYPSTNEIEGFYDENIRDYLIGWNPSGESGFITNKKMILPLFTPTEFKIFEEFPFNNGVIGDYFAFERTEAKIASQIEIRGNVNIADRFIRPLIRIAPQEPIDEKKIVESLIDISKLDLFSDKYLLFTKTPNSKSNNMQKMVFCLKEKDLSSRQLALEIILPEGVEKTLPAQFYGFRSVTNISFPKTLKKIGYGSFAACSSLQKIKIPNGVQEIGPYSFFECERLESINIPDSVSIIKWGAFVKCRNLLSAPVTSAIKKPRWIYDQCLNLQNYKVSSNHPTLRDIDGVLFSKDGTALIHYPGGRDQAVYEVPAGTLVIEEEAFNDALLKFNIEKIIIPDSVEKIKKYAFLSSRHERPSRAIVYLPNQFDNLSRQERTEMGLRDKLIKTMAASIKK